MQLNIEPSTQLSFRRPLTTLTQDILVLRNDSQEPIAFKVKTTAPKQYCVRPNAGRIESGQEVQVQVILQPLKEDPPLDFKCKDKFLVQSIAITPDKETQNLQDLWNSVEKTDKNSISERKLRCSYLPPVVQGEEEATANNPNEYRFPPTYQESATAGIAVSESSGASPIASSPIEPQSYPPVLPNTGDSVLDKFSTSKGEISKSDYISDDQEIQNLRSDLTQAKLRIQTLESQLNESSNETSTIRNRQQTVSANESLKDVSVPKIHAHTSSLLLQPYSDQTFPLQLVVVISVASFLLGAVIF
ncbi:phosphatidylinositol-binding protein scs2 [Basidiobolus ranarum]|uniref:Phosphatidylinositol-binding protein scs2 n=1 Tax=Basidiobolus ranarum TaxID=34480 RepID=A0ABR2W7S9_9FUNG